MKSIIAAAVCLATLLVSCGAFAFAIPERLVYDISWTGIKAGTAVQEIAVDKGGAVRIVSTAHSADWLKLFFPVDDRIESHLSKGNGSTQFGMPLLYRENIHEGSSRRDKEIRFDHSRKEALALDHRGNKQQSKEITDRTWDTLSCFYFARTMKLVPGKSFNIDIFDGGKLWNTEVQVLRREQLETGLGSFKTIVIKPLMKHEGIFNKKGDMYIWLTDDERHLPVKMQSKVKIGSIVATLTGASN